MSKITKGTRLRLKTNGDIYTVLGFKQNAIEIQHSNGTILICNIVQICGMCEVI